MDEDYAHMLSTVGGPDEGNMVPQMQSLVSCQGTPNRDTVLPLTLTCDGDATRIDLTAETQIYESMLHWNDDEIYEPQVDNSCHGDESHAEKHEPTAPPWDEEAELVVPLQGQTHTQGTHPIQCVISPPAHTTHNAVTALAVIGAVFIVMTICIVLTLCWLASQGVHITGFWLTLTPSEWNTRSDDNALQ